MPSRRVPPERRKRTEISCDRCKSRKQKCHKPLDQQACRYCQTHGFDCVTTQPRKKRIFASVEGLGARLTLLECLVKGLVPEVDTSSLEEMRNLGQSLGIPLPPTEPPPREREESPSPDHQSQQDDAPVLRDQQGQTQYIGPASSYLFQIKVRTLFNQGQQLPKPNQFLLFGQNPTERVSMKASPQTRRHSTPQASNASMPPPSTGAAAPEGSDTPPMSDALIAAYFESVQPDFPLLHEATFREEYERFCISPETSSMDPTWLCILLCVLILARRVANPETLQLQNAQEMEEKWWREVQTLLPGVLFTSSISAVQALMLAGLHLHNTNHRDACWTLTAAAVRIAMAIGLHRETNKSLYTPLMREMRKRLWWTLYEFEQMQASSHDRPSAIDDSICSTGTPREAILGMRGDFMQYSNRLAVMLGQACKIIRNAVSSDPHDVYRGPLSPAAALLRDLMRWKETLPPQLRLEHADGKSPSFRRSVLLLHIQHHHVVTVLSRNALLYMAAKVNDSEIATSKDTLSMAEVCIDAGRQACLLLLKLDSMAQFNAVTWWDVYHLYSSAMILVLAIIYDVRQHGYSDADELPESLVESRSLLHQCAQLAMKHLQNPRVPGTMNRWATVVSEITTMTDEFVRRSTSQVDEQNENGTERGLILGSGATENFSGPSMYGFDQQPHPYSRQAMFGDFHIDNEGAILAPSNTMVGSSYLIPNSTLPWHEEHWRDIAGMLLGGDFGV
ncbi:hypothetical protein NA57DRAFT_39015 [Rhizodiscina lignyota]|uniref:Zn(2)-C6 fungal-type domain-containing protein n=1 Tax=Rhizodiscina lignyota TaxID=1504668 RepID=A0A9P4MAN0_9PEZI|nr:hypothetical protein NA57DRAFT_39015 [Rhizodiscina lignyota]